MNLYALALLASVMAYTFILSMVLGQWRRSRGGTLFLFTIFCTLGWTAAEFIAMYYPLEDAHRAFIFRFSAAFWVPIAILFYLFVCDLFNRSPGKTVVLYLGTSLAGFVCYAFTDLGVRSVHPFEWGYGIVCGPLYSLLILGVPGLPGAHAIALLIIATMRTRVKNEKQTYLTLTIGGACALSAALGLNAVVTDLLGYSDFPRIGTASVVFFALCVYIAMKRHQFLTISPTKVAEEVFDDVHDGIILTDTEGRIKRMNPAATEMLGISTLQAEGRTVEALLQRRTAIAQASPQEICIETDGHRRYFSINRTETTNHGMTIGHIVLLSEITKHKRIEEMLLNSRDQLEREVQKRLNELREAKAEIVQQAHQSELAEITTGTLHNVMNLLNTLKISSEMLDRELSSKRLTRLNKANAVLREHFDHIEEFILRDPKGKKLLSYYLQFEELLDRAIAQSRDRVNKIREMVSAIEVIVAAQQKYGGSTSAEEVSIPQLIEDAITMQASSIASHGLNVVKDFSSTPRIKLQKTKLIHILVNLIKNAKEAMAETPPEHRKLIFRTGTTDDHVFVQVSDTGCGISAENLSKMFSYGFTTKQGGHGFGLHTCQTYIAEMGGDLNVSSDGEMAGTTFTLELPIRSDTVQPEARA